MAGDGDLHLPFSIFKKDEISSFCYNKEVNFDYLRYAIEIADCSSLNQAAERLGLSQPNLSRAMKKLQEETGITIFERTTKGLVLTSEGEEFLFHARKILAECHEIEALPAKKANSVFSVAAPYSPYLNAALSLWLRSMPVHQRSVFSYVPTGMLGALPLREQVGILRIQKGDHDALTHYCQQEKLSFISLISYTFQILVSKNNPLADASKIDSTRDLQNQIGILEGAYPISLPDLSLSSFHLPSNRLFESQDFDRILQTLDGGNAYWITLPWPKEALEKHHLVAIPFSATQRQGEDILIYRSLNLEAETFIKSLKSLITADYHQKSM